MTLVLFTGHQAHTSQFSSLDVLGDQSTTQGLIPVGIGIGEIQTILGQCGTWLDGIQTVLTSLDRGDAFTSIKVSINSLSEDIQKVQMLLNELPVSKGQIQAIRNIIIEDIVTSMQALVLNIRETDAAQSIQLLSQYVGEYPAMFETTTRSIYLDGKNITSRITQAIVTNNESSVHNTVEIRSSDKDLFMWADPFYLQAASRIEVHVGNRIIYFLLERRTGGEKSFILWGRSISARDDIPFSEETVYGLDSPTSAREVAEGLTTYGAVDWQCDDWVLPDTFEFRGTPIEGLLKIASVVGAVVRCEDDGSLQIRNRFTTRPIDINGASAALSFDRSTLIEGLSYQEVSGEGYNQIEVYGADASGNSNPELVLEETNPVQGSNTNVRIYWNNVPAPSSEVTDEIATEGVISVSDVITENIQEKIIFNRGVGSTTYPVINFISSSWIGANLGEVAFSTYTKDLVVDSEGATRGYGIAEITYQTQYRVYTIKEHNIEKLIFLISHQLGNNVDVIIKSVGVNDTTFYEAPTISDPLLTDKNVAVIRGRNWLDEHKYDKKIFSIRTPYRDAMLDGNLVFLNDGEIGCSGNFYINTVSIIFDGPKIVNEIGVTQWQV